ncbi:MAG: 3-phosphoshikimate 1-carboxyvinyltransferase [Candidatus Methylomirabilis oxygeniifera]|uniref:3-phosphoshikimate 1-carboxyvinyltransferase n=1 Tax=Methylomirabilis oxygeniifera TaxID=671143 RepID=D5MF98_METO1|nr:MAG: 3-phosphoshikimate 1-carboxyvinyltransferase [Candidatus Methylomirabilis oxyfera]CBE68427.1 3-phosphoshikimate 1-carboxyvinyltransferase (5-enolpyruvylshikimate-3-phosphate synthase) (EPSP synthase) (EPSPS) [Candidatus Methylomirabilis oxyfera]
MRIDPVGPLKGELTVPGDKSITHRAIILGSLADGTSEITGALRSHDCRDTAKAFGTMGVTIQEPDNGRLQIRGGGLYGLKEPQKVLDVGNSGTTMRLLAGVLAAQPFFSVLTGDRYLCARPMARVTVPLRSMGATILGREGGNLPPLAIKGTHLRAIDYASPIASAQVKSAILFAGLFADGRTTVTEPSLSRDHTERMFEAVGIPIHRNGLRLQVDSIKGISPFQMAIPGDFSAAAFFLVAALVIPGSELTLRQVGVNPTRTGLLDALQSMGAAIEVSRRRIVSGEPVADLHVRSQALHGTEVTGELIPRMLDEIPIFAVAAALAAGPTTIRNAAELRVKEVDRLAALVQELRRFGVKIEQHPDGLTIQGNSSLLGCDCDSWGDHRMAMALAVTGLAAEGSTTISDPSSVSSSFPDFWERLNAILPGAAVAIEQ